MNLFLTLTVRTSAVLLVGLGARTALRKRAAALRHLVLAGCLAAAAGVAPLSVVLPSWDVSVAGRFQAPPRIDARQVAPRDAALTVARSGVGDLQRAGLAASSIITRVWFAGFLAFVMMLVGGVLRLTRVALHAPVVSDSRWLRAAEAVAGTYGLRRRIVVRQTRTPHLLATYGIFRPSVLLPSHAREWPDDRIYVVLCHELAHVRRLDWPVHIGAEAVRTLLWFNPLVWLACTYLRRDSEEACDDLVLERGVAARDYASHLVELARKCRPVPGISPLPASPMARRSTLERRITAMLNPRLDRRPLSTRTVVTATALLLAITLPTATLRAVQAGPATLSGTVYDTTGGVMPGVAVTLEDVTQMKYTATTDATGRFAFSNVQPGHYTLEASLPGFRTLNQQFDLTARRDWDRAITLQVGTLRETITVSERRPASPPPANGRPAAVRVGGSIRAPLKTLDVRPVDPASMRDAGREGVVPIEATIGADGTVTSVRVLSAQVHPDFAIAAVDAVRQWRFTPTLLNGRPVEVVMTVSVTFTLSDQ